MGFLHHVIGKLENYKRVSNCSDVGTLLGKSAYITLCDFTWSGKWHFEIQKTWNERTS